MHPCPVNWCEEPVPSDKLMCRAHWFMVPPELQRALYSAYHRRHKDPGAHRTVMQNCINAVNAKIEATQHPREDTCP